MKHICTYLFFVFLPVLRIRGEGEKLVDLCWCLFIIIFSNSFYGFCSADLCISLFILYQKFYNPPHYQWSIFIIDQFVQRVNIYDNWYSS